jgi:hypothetical protein
MGERCKVNEQTKRWLGWCFLSAGLLFGALMGATYGVLAVSIPLGVLGVFAGLRAYREDAR